MADTAVAITAGTGTNIDTRTEGTNGNHRQVVVLGDPATNAGVAPVDATNGLSVDVKASALPSGASTSAKQDTGNTSIASIDTKTPVLGQALAAASVPVVLPAAQITTLTPLSSVAVTATDLDIRNLTNTDVVTAELSAVDNAVLDAIEADTTAIAASVASIDTDTTTIIGHLDGVEGLLTTIDADTGSILTSVDGLETSNSAIQTAVQLLDDTVQVLGTDTFTEASSKGITLGAVRRDADTSLVNTTNEFTPLQVDANGRLKVEAFSGETLPVSLATLPALAAGTNNIGDVDVLTVNGVAPAFGSGVRGATVQRVTIATDDVVPASQSGTWTVQPGNTANTTAWLVNDNPVTSGGLSTFHLVGAATDNATNVKASAGQVYSITAFNLNASPRYLKFHNTSGTPTAGSGVVRTVLIPGNTSGAGAVINIDKGLAFSTGIGISIVTGIADSNTTAIGASEVVVDIGYK